MALYCGKHALWVMRIKIIIAIINNRQMIEWIEPKRKMFEFKVVLSALIARGPSLQPDRYVTAQS